MIILHCESTQPENRNYLPSTGLAPPHSASDAYPLNIYGVTECELLHISRNAVLEPLRGYDFVLRYVKALSVNSPEHEPEDRDAYSSSGSTANCTPDSSFHGGTPAVASGLGGGALANGVAVGPGGRIVAAGSVPFVDPNGESTRPAVAAFTSSGGLDSSFGSGGSKVIDHGHPYALATAVAVQGDGRIVLAGRWQHPQYPVTFGWVERLTSGGQDDTSFAGGSSIYNYAANGAGYASLNAVMIQPDGKIVAAGADLSPPPGVDKGPSAAFVRLDPSGNPDSGFGSSGIQKLSAGTFTPDPYGANGVGIAGGGRIVGAGAMIQNGAHDAGLWASTSAGKPDTEGGFGSGATVVQTGGIEACGMAVAPDGSLVIVGDSVSPARQGPPCDVNSSSSAFAARYIGFGPPPKATPPTAVTGAASGVGEVSATVSGSVNPNGTSTSYHFDYGTSTAYGSSTPTQSAGNGSSDTAVSASLTGLSPATTYHYRLIAQNASGTTTAADAQFTTAPSARPSVNTGGSSGVGEVSATVSGAVNGGGLATSYYFEYGPSAAYGSRTAVGQLGASSADSAVSATLRRLRPGTTYHYRLVATNSDGTSNGGDQMFRTAPRISTVFTGLSKSYSLAKIAQQWGGRDARMQPAVQDQRVDPDSEADGQAPAPRQGPDHAGRADRCCSRASGKHSLHLHLTRKSQKLITRLRRVLVTVRIASTPTHGGPTSVVTRSVTLTG